MNITKEGYTVWCPDLGEIQDDGQYVIAFDHEIAARQVAEKSYHDEPYDSEMVLMARNHLGGVFKVTVWVEPSITLHSQVESVET